MQKIFAMCANGLGPSQIARQLEEAQILTPNATEIRRAGRFTSADAARFPFHWASQSIAQILENRVYLGDQVCMKYTKPSVKSKKRIVIHYNFVGAVGDIDIP